MAAYNAKRGVIELTADDIEALKGGKTKMADRLMNWIIWGNPQGEAFKPVCGICKGTGYTNKGTKRVMCMCHPDFEDFSGASEGDR